MCFFILYTVYTHTNDVSYIVKICVTQFFDDESLNHMVFGMTPRQIHYYNLKKVSCYIFNTVEKRL